MSLTKPQDQTVTIPWWLVLIEGIALVILGILFITNPFSTAYTAGLVIGIYWIISGVFQFVGLFMDRTAWGWKLFAGIISIAAGLVLVNQTLWGTAVMAATIIIILGVQGIVYGGIGLYQAFKGAGWGAGILAALSIVFGLILLTNVWTAVLTLPWVVGVFMLVGGVFAIIAAFKLK